MSQLPFVERTQATGSVEAGAPSAASAAQLRAIAAEFESLLLGQMMKAMRTSMFDDEDGGDDNGPLADSIFSELSLALSRAGGVGVTNALVAPMVRQAASMGGIAGAQGLAAMGGGPAAFSIGAAATATPASLGGPVASLPGRLSSQYGWRRDPIDGSTRFHGGLDLALAAGTDVPAARAGRVVFAGELAGYGQTVVIAHDDRVSTRYGHLSAIDVHEGDDVAAGQTIAKSGSTGRSTGAHLHFEVLDRGQAVDPAASWPLLGGTPR